MKVVFADGVIADNSFDDDDMEVFRKYARRGVRMSIPFVYRGCIVYVSLADIKRPQNGQQTLPFLPKEGAK